MDIATEIPVVPFVLDRERLVASLVKVAGASVSFGVPIGIATEPVLHSAGQVWLGVRKRAWTWFGIQQ